MYSMLHIIGSKVVMLLFHSPLSMVPLYPPIDSNNIAIGVKMVDILERIDAESNKSNPAKANFRQKEAEQSTNQPCQGTSSVIQPGLDLFMDR